MKTRDLSKAQKLIADRDRAAEAAKALSAGDEITITIGKVALVMTADAGARLRNQMITDCNAVVTEATAKLAELGIED